MLVRTESVCEFCPTSSTVKLLEANVLAIVLKTEICSDLSSHVTAMAASRLEDYSMIKAELHVSKQKASMPSVYFGNSRDTYLTILAVFLSVELLGLFVCGATRLCRTEGSLDLCLLNAASGLESF